MPPSFGQVNPAQRAGRLPSSGYTFWAVSATAKPTSLEAVLRRAGAVVSTREGSPVAVHFGSAAAELAVCVRAVGLVDRSDLSILDLEAPPPQLSALMRRHLGATVAPGGLVCGASAWWCGESPDRTVVLCDPRTAARLASGLRTVAARHISVRERSDELCAIGLLGRHTGDVLSALGVYGESGDPRRAKPFSTGSIEGIPCRWLLQSDRRVLAVIPRADAAQAWLAIERAGRPFGISCVGQEAACRYALMERAQPATPPQL
jgi:glycine cleavage system aminomethyltransferase T